MTYAPDATTDVVIPAPHRGQRPILDDPARYKILRCGRRWGKSRMALIAAVLGHGPLDAGEPRWRGIAQGVDVVWLTPDYPQSRAIWREEILPRFRGRPGIELNETERRVTVAGGGTLELRSAEAVDSLRGRKLGGVVIDEAAHMALEAAWFNVIRPALTDLGGWAIIPSTPNGGYDGNQEHLAPSYFNRLCERVMSGAMGPEWQHWHQTTRDNPLLPVSEVAALYAEYPGEQNVQRQQELDAMLIAGGAGLAFPEWRDELHVTKAFTADILRDWPAYAGLDWGFSASGVFTMYHAGPSEQIHVRRDWEFSQIHASKAGEEAAKLCLDKGPVPRFVGCDAQMGAETGTETILELFREGWARGFYGHEVPPVFKVAKVSLYQNKKHRESRVQLTHEGLAWQDDGTGEVKPWQRPKWTFHPDAAACIRTIPRLILDEHNIEDVQTKGDDHAWDSLTYGIMGRPQHATLPKPSRPEGTHPGFAKDGSRKRDVPPEEHRPHRAVFRRDQHGEERMG